jgi:hypothetical protein
MKKTMGFLCLIAISLFSITSCGTKGASSSDPKATVIEFGKRMAKKDFKGAAELASEASQQYMQLMIKGAEMAEKFKDDKQEKSDLEEFEKAQFGDAVITGETAVVPVTMKDEKNSVEIPLIKEKGAWKINFTPETMMKMAKQQGNGDANMDPSQMDALKNMDPEKMKKAMEMAQDVMNDPEKMKMIQDMMKQYGTDPEKMKDVQKLMQQYSDPEKLKAMQDMMKAFQDSVPGN